MIPKDFKQLLEEYRNGTMDAEQRPAFERLLHGSESEEQLKQLIDFTLEDATPVNAEETSKYLYERIKDEHIKEEVPVVRMAWWRYAAVAVLIIGVGLYFLLSPAKQEQPVVKNNTKEQKEIAPGRDGAILTLADGKEVVLDSVANGVIATQNGARIVLKNGSLTYDKTAQTDNGITYNTMRTPRGRQFQLILPDGSRVWLNAASSIKYPTIFNGADRTVEIDGEAYFEVVKNDRMPFKVKIHDAEVAVLGTHFNINVYDNEPVVRTTLLEGKVKVTATGSRQSAILRPGQQAVFTHDSRLTIHDSVDINQVMAWKNGLFNFNGYDIRSVMRELSRWYDLDIIYEAEPEPTEVMGEMQRNLNLSQVMNILQKIGVQYRIEGRKLIVMAQGQ